ncbi:hypothetical protein BKA66DRAFT_458292 [Pyrenochaeta sp. MPI-SDFR-AT-0127]|nr:hypothetical protein BKA66DRAFT_458292 [Pyrenochaeta sp. MPI-SDFR-AT-0127]
MARRSSKRKFDSNGHTLEQGLKIKKAVQDNNYLPSNGVSRTLRKNHSSLTKYKQLLVQESRGDVVSVKGLIPSGELPQPTHIRFDYDDMEHFAPRALELQRLMQEDAGGLHTCEAARDVPLNFELLRTATELKQSELNECLALIEMTSGDDYRASRVGWDPSKKKAEMLDKEMMYLLVRQGDVAGNFETVEGDHQTGVGTDTEEKITASLDFPEHLTESHAFAGDVDSITKLDPTLTANAFANHEPASIKTLPTQSLEWPYMKSSGTILGFISFMFTYDDPPNDDREVVYIYEIHLHEHLRGRGLGSRLMGFVEGAASHCGIGKTMLTVFTSNEGARAMYEKLGYNKDECSPTDRIMRSKTVKADYMIMSKIVPLIG